MPLYLGNSLISDVYVGTVATGVTNITLPSPSISVNSSTGLITATVTNNTAGYLQTSSASATSQLTTQGATTITPNSTNQTAATAGKYLLGNIIVSAVPTETKTISANGTYTPSSGKYFSSVTVSISGGGGGIDTSDATAVAGDILLNKTAYVNGVKITGSMPNNGALSGTISTQDGTYTIPAGYTSGGTVTASLTATTLTNSIISGAAYAEATGDYAWRSTVQIPAGYHNATTLTKDFSSIFPAPDTPATAAQILLNYQAFDKDGKIITGTMTNNSVGTITLDQTTTSYTIPAGYHDGTGKVQHTTVNIPDPTITVSSSGLITASGSWTRGFTTDNSYSKTQQLTTKAATTYTPGTTNQTIASGTYLTGTQTISGDANLVAGNIKSGVSIFGVTGSYTGSSGSSKNVQVAAGVNRVNTTSYTAVSGQTLTVAETGTYDVYWSGYRSSTSGTSGSQLYIEDTAYGSVQTTFSNNGQSVHLTGVSLTKNDVITVRARARNTSYYMYVSNLTIVQTA